MIMIMAKTKLIISTADPPWLNLIERWTGSLKVVGSILVSTVTFLVDETVSVVIYDRKW